MQAEHVVELHARQPRMHGEHVLLRTRYLPGMHDEHVVALHTRHPRAVQFTPAGGGGGFSGGGISALPTRVIAVWARRRPVTDALDVREILLRHSTMPSM
jgi:hypothetical protein